MKRKIIGSGGIGLRTVEKSSRGFVYDTAMNNYLVPEFVRLSDDDAYTLFRGNEWVNATVNHIVDDCTKVAIRLVQKDKTMKLRPRHERVLKFLYDFFRSPNKQKESFSEIREKFIKDMLVVGKGTAEKVFTQDRIRILEEVYSLNASTMKISADEHGDIPDTGAFVQKSKEGKEIYFDKDEVIWCIFRPLSCSMYGEKPLDTLANAVASDILRATYNSNFFLNGAEASGVLSLENMNKTELQRFKQYWKDNHKGVKNAHRMVAVNVPVNYVKMALTNRDLQFSEYGKEIMMKIFAVYAMQPFVMGVIDGTSGKLNSEQQAQLYKDNALKPILRKEATYYTKEILENGFGVTDFEVVFEGIDLSDTKTQSEIDRQDINSGILTINEVRIRRGLVPVPWGDTPISVLPGGNQIDPDTGRIVPPSQQGDGDKPDNDSDEEGSDEE